MNTLDYIIERFKPEIAERGGSLIKNVNRVIMAEVLAELGFKEGVEVGVAEGLHAEVLLDKNPNLLLKGVDLYQQYIDYKEYENPLDCFLQAEERLKRFGKRYNLIKMYSMDTVIYFKDNSLDFVFIDGAHDFKNIAMDIVEWSKKVKPGGIVYGHDYKRTGKHSKNKVDVKDVVDAYMYAMGIKPWFILADDIKNDQFGQDNPCWMFVKP